MKEEYVKSEKILCDKKENEKEIDLIISILKTRKELEEANRNFEYAEAEMIDYYIYQIKANRAKLNYLLKKAKNRGIILDSINRAKIKYNRAI